MGERWLNPTEDPPRETTIRERGEILLELLDLADALPALERRDLDAPTFAELCERR